MSDPHRTDPTDDRPGPYRGVFGGPATPYPSVYARTAPKQVAIASVISLGLGALCVLLAALTVTSAGEQISEVLTDSKDNQPAAVAAAMFCAVLYTLPALYLRKGRPWARYLLIGVAAMGIAGGIMSLPAGVLGLAIHLTLMVLMFQTPTNIWIHHRGKADPPWRSGSTPPAPNARPPLPPWTKPASSTRSAGTWTIPRRTKNSTPSWTASTSTLGTSSATTSPQPNPSRTSPETSPTAPPGSKQ
jgi:hypothetical protein